MLCVLLSRTRIQSFKAIRLKLCLVASAELFAHFLPYFGPQNVFRGSNEKNEKPILCVLLSRTPMQSFKAIRLKLCLVAPTKVLAHFLPYFGPQNVFRGSNEKNDKPILCVLLSRTPMQSFEATALLPPPSF